MRSISAHRARWTGLTLAAVAAASVLTSGVVSATTEPTDTEPSEPAALPTADEYFETACPTIGTVPETSTELVYWSAWTEGEPQAEVIQKALDCFTEQTGVEVDVQWLGRSFLTEAVIPGLNTGDVPDLIDADIARLRASVVDAGATQDVGDVLDYLVGEGDATVGDVLPAGTYDLPENRDADGNLYMLPYELIGDAWFYNADVLPDLEDPATMDELFALFDASIEAGRGAIAQDGDINFYNAYFYTQIAEDYVGAGGVTAAASDTTGEVWTTDEGLLRAAEYVERLAAGDYLIEGWDAARFPQLQQQWADGAADFAFNGSWLPSEANQYLATAGSDAAINYGSFQFPLADGATHNVVEQMPIGFAVLKDAEHADAAKAFIAYFLNRDLLVGIAAVAENMTPRTDVAVPVALEGIAADLAAADERALLMDGLDGLAGGAWVEEVFYPANNALLKGEITAAEFVEQVASGTADFWANQ